MTVCMVPVPLCHLPRFTLFPDAVPSIKFSRVVSGHSAMPVRSYEYTFGRKCTLTNLILLELN